MGPVNELSRLAAVLDHPVCHSRGPVLPREARMVHLFGHLAILQLTMRNLTTRSKRTYAIERRNTRLVSEGAEILALRDEEEWACRTHRTLRRPLVLSRQHAEPASTLCEVLLTFVKR